MNSLARQHWWQTGRLYGDVAFYPYQIALGLTFRWWPGEYDPSIRLHIGPFKVFAALARLREG